MGMTNIIMKVYRTTHNNIIHYEYNLVTYKMYLYSYTYAYTDSHTYTYTSNHTFKYCTCGFESHPRQLIFHLQNWVCCVALPCFLFDLACLFLPSFSTLIKTCMYIYILFGGR